MSLTSKRILTASLALPLISVACPAYETPLSDVTVREAYFLGQHHDASTQSALKPYIHTLASPAQGPYISEVRVFTPYAQVIEKSSTQSTGYSAQQAAADYHSHSDTIVVRFHIQFTPTYSYIESEHGQSDRKAQKGLVTRSENFWQAFNAGLSQNDQWIEPLYRDGEPIYVQTLEGGSVLDGAYVWLTFDANDVASEPVTAEIFTPDGQHVTSTFDLSVLR